MIITIIAIAAACLLTAIYLGATRRRSVPRLDLNLDRVSGLEDAAAEIAGLSGGSALEGNDATIYQNGRLLDVMLEAIAAARRTIHLESYVWTKGAAEKAFVDCLCRKAQAGVTVRLLIDAIGGAGASNEQLARLKSSGVHVGIYHPISRFSIRRFNNRTHRKLLIIDGSTAFTFGHGIRDEWYGDAQDKSHWRDTGVGLRGPVVCALQGIFAQDWTETTGSPPLGEGCFLQAEREGSAIAHVVSSSIHGGPSAVALLYLLAIASARQEILIQNAYFAPGPQVLRLLDDAVKRGVRVRLMLPGRYSDSPLVRRAGQHLYDRLLHSGVHIDLYNKTFLHQKIVVVDGVWSHIGSTNFDDRSLVLNAEIGVGLFDKRIAAQLREAFDDDICYCDKLTLDQWESRPWYQQSLDRMAYWLHSQI